MDLLDNYQKNLQALQDVTDQLMGLMKGHIWSYRGEISDRNGKFSPQRLQDLTKQMMAIWEEKVRAGTDAVDGVSLAEPYLTARRELYGLYLWLSMRCSLYEGAYTATCGRRVEERTDFVFLLQEAKYFTRSWCVMKELDGTRRNELYWGFDHYFGLHLYHAILDPEDRRGDTFLALPGTAPVFGDIGLTNEGNLKRIYLQRSEVYRLSSFAEETDAWDATEDVEAPENYEDDEDYGDDAYEDDYDPLERQWELEAAGLVSTEPDSYSEEEDTTWLSSLALNFEGAEEYLQACRRFVSLFQQAKPDVLHGFYEEIEEIVDLYLAHMELSPLTDTNRSLDIYSQVFDGPCQEARKYVREMQWNRL